MKQNAESQPLSRPYTLLSTRGKDGGGGGGLFESLGGGGREKSAREIVGDEEGRMEMIYRRDGKESG